MYLATSTRPDIAFAVSSLARKAAKPSSRDVAGVKRLFRYLQGTLATGISLGGSSLILSAFADADYATDIDTRRSISGNLVLIGESPVIWSSRRQTCVTLSTVEAEYVSLCGVAQTVMWLRGLLQELGAKQLEPTVLHEDNQGAISLAKGSQVGQRSKHIDVRLHYIRERFSEGAISITHCKSEDMLADILTKPLGRIAFERLRSQIMTASRCVREEVSVTDSHLAIQSRED